MNILEITQSTIYTVITDENDCNEYTRYGPDNWMVAMGESLESVYDCEKLERMFQKMFAK